MKIKFVVLFIAIFFSINAQAFDDVDAGLGMEDNIASSSKIAPSQDFDNLYRFPLSNTEGLELGGNLDFDEGYTDSQELQLTFSLKYSMSF